MRVYKVVFRFGGALFSNLARGLAMVRYKPGEWVEAPGWLKDKGYGLFAFEDLRSARRFFYSEADEEIWEAEAEGVTKELPPVLSVTELALGECIEVSGSYPEGTVMCTRLKLVRRVE